MILADITIFQCDRCTSVIACKDAASWKLFDDCWADGMLHHYCPACSEKSEIAEAIIREKKAISAALKQAIGKPEEEVIDAEFIN